MPSPPTTADVIKTLFDMRATGRSPQDIALLFSEEVDWFVAGDTAHVPWIGRKTGRTGVIAFHQELPGYLEVEKLDVRSIMVDGDRGVALGELRSRYRPNGALMETAFCFDITVRDGLIVRFRVLEDSFNVSQAVRQERIRAFTQD